MLGAIIGDMAAYAWEEGKPVFYDHLIHLDYHDHWVEDTILAAIDAFNQPDLPIGRHQTTGYSQYWMTNLIYSIVFGWQATTLEECRQNVYRLVASKENWYANHYISQIIFSLRHGDTKRRAKKVGPFEQMAESHWKEGKGPLSYLIRAWSAFEQSYDFSSSIHNAVKLPGNVHYNCILVGAIASAMYGCKFYIKKKKYCWGDEKITHPLHVAVSARMEDLIREQWLNRVFFPKNHALTDVERHTWSAIKTPFAGICFSPEMRRRMLKGYSSSIAPFAGVYWDDGWFYVYRHWSVLARFRLTRQQSGSYLISQLQAADNQQDAADGLADCIGLLQRAWYKFTDEPAQQTYLHACKYYHCEPECPFAEGSDAAKWWLGESQMLQSCGLVRGNQPTADDWQQSGILQQNTDHLVNPANRGLSREELEIREYLRSWHSKWFPYDTSAYMNTY